MHSSAAHSPRPNRAEWLLTLLLGGNLAWTMLTLGGYRPDARVVTYSLTGALLVTHFLTGAWERRTWRALHPAAWALVPFLAYGALNVAFLSPVPWLGWLDWLGWANLGVTFWVTLNGIRSGPTRRALFLFLTLLGLSAVALGCYQRFVQPDWLMLGREKADQFVGRASGPFGIPNSLAGFLILLLPATGALAWRGTAAGRVWWSWVTAVLVVGLFLTVSRGAWLALMVALVAWPLFASRRSWSRRLVTAGAALAGLTLVLAVVYWVSPQTRTRLERLVTDSGELSRPILWRGAWQLWRADPVLGTGAGTFNVLFERHRPAGFLDEPQWVHNEYLNTLSDYGAIGLGLALGAVGWAVRWRRQRRIVARMSTAGGTFEAPAVSAGLGVGCLAFALQMAVDFHLKIPALGMALAVVAALALGRSSETPASADVSPATGSRWGWGAAALAAAIGLVAVLRWQQADALRYAARERLDRVTRAPGESPRDGVRWAEAELRRAVSLWPVHGGAWTDLAHALQIQAYFDPARSRELAEPAVAAARRALAISDVVPESWLRLGIALEMQGSRSDALAAFEQALRLAPRSAVGWYYYAEQLSRDTKARGAALRAIATCLSLDPGNAPAEALRMRLSPLP